MFQSYEEVKLLGRGSYGEVHLVKNNENQLFALKKVPKTVGSLESEYKILKNISSYYVVKAYAYWEDQDHAYLVMDYCDGGDLQSQQIKQPGRVFNISQATKIAADIVQGLNDIHSKGYVHRDVKLNNILIKKKEDMNIYLLADFGFAKKEQDLRNSFKGTLRYMSPEMISSERYSFEVDVWAFGVLFYFMLNGNYPFYIDKNILMEQRKIALLTLSTNFSYQKLASKIHRPQNPKSLEKLEDFFRRVFQFNPQKRITILQIKEHPLFHEQFILGIPINSQNSREERELIRPKIPLSESYKFQIQKISFLLFLNDQLKNSKVITLEYLLSLRYCILKYFLILMEKMEKEMRQNPQHPDTSLDELEKTIIRGKQQFLSLYEQCKQYLPQIEQINSFFLKAFSEQISGISFEGDFKKAYRTSTGSIYLILRKKNQIMNQNNAQYLYYICLTTLCHGFNHLLKEQEQVFKIFDHYSLKNKFGLLNFKKLAESLKEEKNSKTLTSITKRFLDHFFG